MALAEFTGKVIQARIEQHQELANYDRRSTRIDRLPQTLSVAGRFRDIGDLSSAAGWDLAFRQLDHGPQELDASLKMGGNVGLLHMRFNRRFHQLGFPPGHTLAFGLPVQGMKNWFGRGHDPSSVLPFNQASGVDGVSEAGFEAYALAVSSDFLDKVSDIYQIPVAEVIRLPGPESTITSSVELLGLRTAVSTIMKTPSALLDSESESGIVVDLLNAALAGGQNQDKSTLATRTHALIRALDYMTQHECEPITVGEICQATDTPLRTLSRAFREKFGLSPKAYVKRLRFNGVRNELLQTDPGAKVSDIANYWGFWHMGQFARDYRVLFGELPSETLQTPTVHRYTRVRTQRS